MAKRDYIPCACCSKTFKPVRDTNLFCSNACYKKNKKPQPKTCQQCKCSYLKKLNQKASKFCSNDCLLESRRVKPHTCVVCGTIFTPVKFKPSVGKYRKYTGRHSCSVECAFIDKGRRTAKRMHDTRDQYTGKNNPNWIGACLKKNKSYRGHDWRLIAEQARNRDKYCCKHCGMTSEEHFAKWSRVLEVHHIIPFYEFTDHTKANSLRNLITLCKRCHRIADGAIKHRQLLINFNDEQRLKPKDGLSRGSKNANAKLNEIQVKEIKMLFLQGVTNIAIGEKFNVSKSMISAIRTGQNWKHVSLN